MAAPEGSPNVLTDLLRPLVSGWPAAGWEWDGRLDCALSTLNTATAAQAQAAIAASLPDAWTAASLSQAPGPVQQICARTGGLQGGQQVHAAQLPDGTLVYCLWWPWGSGTNFSARVGAVGAADGRTQLRAALGIQ